MTKIKFDKRNYRIHNDKNKVLIRKSLQDCGTGRSIVIDNEDEIVCGNGVYEQAKALNIPVKVIETDGTELIAVKRTDLRTEDEKRKQLAVMDNSTSDSSKFDLELLSEDFNLNTLKDFGVKIKDKDVEYSRKIDTPIYEIKGENPSLSELVDTKKADDLIREVKESKLPEEIKDFLILTATRLYEFNYSKIAEFYAHQNKDVQDLMEKQALVLIDFQKAVELGYVELNEFINNVFISEVKINA